MGVLTNFWRNLLTWGISILLLRHLQKVIAKRHVTTLKPPRNGSFVFAQFWWSKVYLAELEKETATKEPALVD